MTTPKNVTVKYFKNYQEANDFEATFCAETGVNKFGCGICYSYAVAVIDTQAFGLPAFVVIKWNTRQMLHSLDSVYERGERGSIEAYIRTVDKSQMMKVELQNYAGLDHTEIWEHVEKMMKDNDDLALAYTTAERINYDMTCKWFLDAIATFSTNSPAL